MVPKQPTNQPTDRQTGGTQPTDEQTSAGFGKQQKTQEKVSFQAFTMRKQSCSLPCHCKAVRNTLANTQVSQTSKTRPHARNNWGTWRGHNNQLCRDTLRLGTIAGVLCGWAFQGSVRATLASVSLHSFRVCWARTEAVSHRSSSVGSGSTSKGFATL